MNHSCLRLTQHSIRLASFLALLLALGCGSTNPSEPLQVEPEGEITDTPCTSNTACNDGIFCNGTESCDNGFCRLGVTPRCDDGIECTRDICSHKTSSCQFLPPDEDGDGHADANCFGPDGESLGDDCDDDDADRYPGNSEICSKSDPTHDEDCDPKSYGYQDNDADGEVADTCCNEDADGKFICGPDCDDDDYRRNHDYPEICDDIDNDCDGKVDKNTKEVLWYPDNDGDHFGTESEDAILSCAPIDDRSLRASDCDDNDAAIHIAAREECDGVDNDCDGDIDEDGVCACAPDGNARTCSCGGTLTGIQLCDAGLWNSCDCSECITGATDCVGELLPRQCVDGRWQVLPACRSSRPICIEGECMCADGSDNCATIIDVLRPYVKATAPLHGSSDTTAQASLAVEFNEDIAPASAANGVLLTNAHGVELPGTVNVGGSILYFEPNQPLGVGQTYQFYVKSTVTDLAGNALLPHSKVTFRTKSELTATRVGEGTARTLSAPKLAVNEAGNALLLVTNSAAPGFPGAPPYTTRHSWQETKFVGGSVLSYDTQTFNIAFDDANQFVIGESNGSEHKVHFQNSSGGVTSESLSTNGNLNITPVFANPAGGAMAIFSDSNQLAVTSGLISGFNSHSSLTNLDGFIQEIIGDVGNAGRGFIAFRDSGIHIFLSNSGLETWQVASMNPAFTNVLTFSAVQRSNSVTTVAWINWTTVGGQGSLYQVFTQDLGSDGEWLGSPSQPRGTFGPVDEGSPNIVADAADNLILSYVRGVQLVAVTRSANGVWGPETIFNPPSDLSLGASRLRMAQSGEAVLGWVAQSAQPSTVDLWVARYSPITGWAPARLVEDTPSDISEFDIGIDGSGNVLVVYTTNTEDAVWTKL